MTNNLLVSNGALFVTWAIILKTPSFERRGLYRVVHAASKLNH